MGHTIDGRLAYADLLRAVATIAVITLHMAGSQMGAVGVTTSAWAVFNVYNGLVRWCVPVFVMLSGMFLLDPKKVEKLGHTALRILRIFVALVVWAAVYALANHVATGGVLSWAGLKSALWSAVLGNTHYHLWFLYMRVLLGPEQVIPVEEALLATTRHAAWQYHMEDRRGTLAPGKVADLIVLDADPTSLPPDQVEHIRVMETFRSGKSVWRR